MATGSDIISSETLRGMRLEEYERTIYRAMSKMGNRQRMIPVEYIVRGWDLIHGSAEVNGTVMDNGKNIGEWSATIDADAIVDRLVASQLPRKEQNMKALHEVYIVREGKFVDVWTGVASTAEGARFKALKELEIETDIEDLDIFTRQIGTLRDDCCK